MSVKKHVHLVFVRHTQTDFNVQRRYTSVRGEAVLTEHGRSQANSVANRLSDMPIRAIYASDLIRTRQVAMYLYKACGVSLAYDQRLREVDVGTMTGLTKDEALVQYPQKHFRTRDPSYDFTTIGGESRDQVIARQIDCFDDILSHYGVDRDTTPQVVVIVGHGTSLTTLLHHLQVKPKLHEQGGWDLVLYSGV